MVKLLHRESGNDLPHPSAHPPAGGKARPLYRRRAQPVRQGLELHAGPDRAALSGYLRYRDVEPRSGRCCTKSSTPARTRSPSGSTCRGADMEAAMAREGIPLYSLESRRPVADFDLVGITLPVRIAIYQRAACAAPLGHSAARRRARGATSAGHRRRARRVQPRADGGFLRRLRDRRRRRADPRPDRDHPWRKRSGAIAGGDARADGGHLGDVRARPLSPGIPLRWNRCAHRAGAGIRGRIPGRAFPRSSSESSRACPRPRCARSSPTSKPCTTATRSKSCAAARAAAASARPGTSPARSANAPVGGDRRFRIDRALAEYRLRGSGAAFAFLLGLFAHYRPRARAGAKVRRLRGCASRCPRCGSRPSRWIWWRRCVEAAAANFTLAPEAATDSCARCSTSRSRRPNCSRPCAKFTAANGRP